MTGFTPTFLFSILRLHLPHPSVAGICRRSSGRSGSGNRPGGGEGRAVASRGGRKARQTPSANITTVLRGSKMSACMGPKNLRGRMRPWFNFFFGYEHWSLAGLAQLVYDGYSRLQWRSGYHQFGCGPWLCSMIPLFTCMESPRVWWAPWVTFSTTFQRFLPISVERLMVLSRFKKSVMTRSLSSSLPKGREGGAAEKILGLEE